LKRKKKPGGKLANKSLGMERVSSNLTLFLKFFVPVFWLVFFGGFTLASLLSKYSYVGNIPAVYFKVGVVVFYLSGILMFGFTLLRLVRVELGAQEVYVTNYFKHIQYTLDSVESLQVSRFGFFAVGTLTLKAKGTLGRRLTFVVNNSRLEDFWEKHPEVQAYLMKD
jgi:hypothetical protein